MSTPIVQRPAFAHTGEDGLPGEHGHHGAGLTAGDDHPRLVGWAERARAVNAQPWPSDDALGLLARHWALDPLMSGLTADALERMAPFLQVCRVPADQTLIRQDERGDFMLVLLDGSISVVRRQEWGEVLVLAHLKPGQLAGEMSLLDAGERFSACLTDTECAVAVLTADGLQALIESEPRVAATLVTLLARKLSVRLRTVSARLGGRAN